MAGWPCWWPKRSTGRSKGLSPETYFTPEELEELSYAAWLHDIGKIGVRERVLEKSNKLSDDRMELIASRFDRIAQNLRLECKGELLGWYVGGSMHPETARELKMIVSGRCKSVQDDLAFCIGSTARVG